MIKQFSLFQSQTRSVYIAVIIYSWSIYICAAVHDTSVRPLMCVNQQYNVGTDIGILPSLFRFFDETSMGERSHCQYAGHISEHYEFQFILLMARNIFTTIIIIIICKYYYYS